MDTPAQIHFEQRVVPEGTVLSVCGEIDDFTAQELRLRLQHLRQRSSGTIQLDLAGLLYVNSTGVGVLAQTWRAMQREGRPFLLVATPEPVRSLFRALALERLLAD